MQYLKNTFLLLMITVLSISSCKKDDEAPTTSSILIQGNWRTTLYVFKGSDKLSSFAGYNFSFSDNGVVSAVKPGVAGTVTGSWSTSTVEKQNYLKFNFGSAASFSELSQDWKIVEQTSSKIRLEHSSSGTTGTDLLTFEKN